LENPINGHCIEKSGFKADWDKAKRYCMNKGGHLLTLDSFNSTMWFKNMRSQHHSEFYSINIALIWKILAEYS